MSRSGYSDDSENPAMWRGQVRNAIRGKRGQKLLIDMVAALDAMPEKELYQGHLVTPEGGVCALGALGQARGVDMSQFERFIDPDGSADDPQALAEALGGSLNAAHQLIMEVQYMNDEWFSFEYVPNPALAVTWVNGPRAGYGIPMSIRRDYTPEERWRKMREWAQSKIIATSQP